jgi:hypothetical protein
MADHQIHLTGGHHPKRLFAMARAAEVVVGGIILPMQDGKADILWDANAGTDQFMVVTHRKTDDGIRPMAAHPGH